MTPIDSATDLTARIACLEESTSSLHATLTETTTRYQGERRRMRIQSGLAVCAVIGAILVAPASRRASAGGGDPFTDIYKRLVYLDAKTKAIAVNGNDFVLTGVNVHIVDGTGNTNSSSGLGNLTIGYNAPRSTERITDVRTGSHNLILGDQNDYSSYAGIIAGSNNSISAPYACVSGGTQNVASGNFTSITGGAGNSANGFASSITGGANNSTLSLCDSISGGIDNSANGGGASVSGGQGNKAKGSAASVSGGNDNTASAYCASVCGGFQNQAVGQYCWIGGGALGYASGNTASVAGGENNSAISDFCSVTGGQFNVAKGFSTSVCGGQSNTAGGEWTSVSGGLNLTQSVNTGWTGGTFHSP